MVCYLRPDLPFGFGVESGQTGFGHRPLESRQLRQALCSVWHIGLWAGQIALALAYGSARSMKLFQPIEALVASGLTYVAIMPELFIRFVELMKILGAIGLILPTLTRILPKLTPAAAVGLSIVQVGAIILHTSRAELVILQ